MTATKTLTMERAEDVAYLLLRMPGVYKVYLFGSTARGEEGKDIDIIATVSERNFKLFSRLLEIEPGQGIVYDLAVDRFRAAGKVLEWNEAALRQRCQDTPLDIFLFPTDWLGRQDEMQRSFRHGEDTFTRRIAADTRLFDVIMGEFEEDSVPTRSRAA